MKSFRETPKLVIISAKKKCLNLTTPKGEMKIYTKTLSSSNLDLKQKTWKGNRHIKTKIITKARAQVPLGGTNRYSSFVIKI